MMQARCTSCGEFFWREHGECWKVLCLECWKVQKNISAYDPGEVARLQARVYSLEALRDILQNEIDRLQEQARIGAVIQSRAKDLLFLVHPDKHNGDHRALEISQWINGEVRNG